MLTAAVDHLQRVLNARLWSVMCEKLWNNGSHNCNNKIICEKIYNLDLSVGLISSSSCHQTAVFHLFTQDFAVSLKFERSSKVRGRARRVHCSMCAVFSVARPHCCCCLPTPMTLASEGVQCSCLWSTSQLLRPSGQKSRSENVVHMWVQLKR